MNPCSRSATHSRQHDTTQLKKKKKSSGIFFRVIACFLFWFCVHGFEGRDSFEGQQRTQDTHAQDDSLSICRKRAGELAGTSSPLEVSSLLKDDVNRVASLQAHSDLNTA